MNDDHSSRGRELDLFDTSPLVGPGLPLWLPDGGTVRGELERFALELSLRSGCRRVNTPVLAKRELFERSGHWQKFSADMFAPVRVGAEEYVLRPANCPHHTQVYAARPHSHRDLPVRYAELGSMFRSELSGVLMGLRRVRQISLDDAHSFCRPDQVVEEVRIALAAIEEAYAVLGIRVARFRLSVRGPGGSYLGDDALWERAEGQLREALGDRPHDVAPGEAAFYGPKVDVQVADAAGREETLSTVQVDHVQPERFGLEFTGADGARHRPVMVHRGLLSSMERLVAMLLEQDGGRLPTWLSPVQVRVLPVSGERHGERAREIARGARGLRVEVDEVGPLNRRVRDARARRVPHVVVVGDAEVADGSVAVDGRQVPAQEFLDAVLGEVVRRGR
ncbi:threonine--tRNA ligase [Kineococcus rhizosphaerae]|uniref:Threonine--tRNA ligase n=1 Tax=Kineococcus rhizosphaerae TaxID=559628 RepID=A0A2T0QXS8_9ACTN|nr:threonine--tRNA ligase [Kineococcus rhizosphaerae]PRY10838.1 threonyl-tRNA synthetase [Kineococcus rhizosphaerae]